MHSNAVTSPYLPEDVTQSDLTWRLSVLSLRMSSLWLSTWWQIWFEGRRGQNWEHHTRHLAYTEKYNMLHIILNVGFGVMYHFKMWRRHDPWFPFMKELLFPFTQQPLSKTPNRSGVLLKGCCSDTIQTLGFAPRTFPLAVKHSIVRWFHAHVLLNLLLTYAGWM